MNITSITAYLAATTTAATIAISPALNFITPRLWQMIEYREQTVIAYETAYPGSAGSTLARAQWEAKKPELITQIQALEEVAKATSPEEISAKAESLFQPASPFTDGSTISQN